MVSINTSSTNFDSFRKALSDMLSSHCNGIYDASFSSGRIRDSVYYDEIPNYSVNSLKVMWVPVDSRLPVEKERKYPMYGPNAGDCINGESYTASDLVFVTVEDDSGYKFVSTDMLCNGRWANYSCMGYTVTHWMELPDPAE